MWAQIDPVVDAPLNTNKKVVCKVYYFTPLMYICNVFIIFPNTYFHFDLQNSGRDPVLNGPVHLVTNNFGKSRGEVASTPLLAKVYVT